MSGRKGIEATKRLRSRVKNKRGGNVKERLEFDRSDSQNMADYAEEYLHWLAVRNYTERTIEGRRYKLSYFLKWSHERTLVRACDVTKLILESYQRHLYHYRKKNGKPLGYSSQRGYLGAVRDFFRWLCRSNYLPYNPASEIEMPRPEKTIARRSIKYRTD